MNIKTGIECELLSTLSECVQLKKELDECRNEVSELITDLLIKINNMAAIPDD